MSLVHDIINDLSLSRTKALAGATRTLIARLAVVEPKPMSDADQDTSRDIPATVVLAHLYYMLDEIEKMEDAEKAMRWLGWIQGVMWSHKIASLKELRDSTRAALKG
jgi:hypothetical protein